VLVEVSVNGTYRTNRKNQIRQIVTIALVWALQWLGILPLLFIAAVFCSCLQVLKYLLTYKIWHAKCAIWWDYESFLILSPALWYMAHHLSLSWKATLREAPIFWQKYVETGHKMKTNGYLIFNYSNLDVYEAQYSGFWPLVITHFNAAVLTFCVWFKLNGMTRHGWQLGLTKCPAIVQTTLGAVKKCLSFSKVDCCQVL